MQERIRRRQQRLQPGAGLSVLLAAVALLLVHAGAASAVGGGLLLGRGGGQQLAMVGSGWRRGGVGRRAASQHRWLAFGSAVQQHEQEDKQQQGVSGGVGLAARRRSALAALARVRGGGGTGPVATDGGWATVVEGLKNGCASGLAAACAKLLLQPFDTVKTLQQATKGSLGMLEAGKDLVARKGVGALYTGLGVTLVGSIPAVSVYFGVYQASKKAMLQALPPGLAWSLLGVAASAAIGNTVASVFRVPYEVVKQRLQAGMYSSTGQALRTMYADGGVAAFFGRGGVASQILRDVPYAIVTLLTYESLRRLRAELRKGEPSTPFEDSMIGAVAGGVGSFISNPMDVVKTRIMTQPGLYPTVGAAVATIWAEEGPAAFFKGTAPRLLHKVPANAIFFATYEIFRALLRVHG